MLAIGSYPRKWTLLLLLLCSPATLAQPQNDTPQAGTAPALSPPPSATDAQSGVVTPSTPRTATTAKGPTCPPRTPEHYITRTLSDQCPETRWGPASQIEEPGAHGAVSRDAWAGIPWIREITAEEVAAIQLGRHGSVRKPRPPAASARRDGEAEAYETDSSLDTANFLSFEEWKKKNLERAGQSPENVGHGRAHPEHKNRQRPDMKNALDALGEEGEIDIDFSGFGKAKGEASGSGSSAQSGAPGAPTQRAEGEDKVAPASFALSKDAGKTCRERFNYASFDCAATVLKTNKEAKSSSAVLVESKDYYMRNQCAVDNKFLIVELCDDILVDTVVLANYEFFSGMVRHFRVSVSDRYPVKLDRWRTLGTFEARNNHEVQPFLIAEPQIWARYLRIEFLTHYGSEFYCTISVLRVHGTTMLEQFRREEEEARGDDDFVEPIEEAAVDMVKTAEKIAENVVIVPTVDAPAEPVKAAPPEPERQEEVHAETGVKEPAPASSPPSATSASASSPHTELNTTQHVASSSPVASSGAPESSASEPSTTPAQAHSNIVTQGPAPSGSERNKTTGSAGSTPSAEAPPSSPTTNKSESAQSSEQNAKSALKSSSESSSIVSSSSSAKASTNTNTTYIPTQQQPPQQRPTPQNTPQHAPTTQESFFKSIHKRLQSLEANSTLSLQYIEDQSRMLRDAFLKAEKRLSQRTAKFLTDVDHTVIQELKTYKTVMESSWQELGKRLDEVERKQGRESAEIGVRLSMITDELVWQKRMAVVQSTLLLLCLALVLVRMSPKWGGSEGESGPGLVSQQISNTYGRFFDLSPPRSPENEGVVRRRRTFRSMWRSDASIGISERSDAESTGARSPGVEFSSPAQNTSGYLDTPGTGGAAPRTPGEEKSDGGVSGQPSPAQDTGVSDIKDDAETSGAPNSSPPATATSTPSSDEQTQEQEQEQEQARRFEALATQSGPATPRGSRDAQPSWEEVDRAVDKLKAGEQRERRKQAVRNRWKSISGPGAKENRSPLRRAESYDDRDECGGDSPGSETGEGLFGM